jgi:hypothetical protein
MPPVDINFVDKAHWETFALFVTTEDRKDLGRYADACSLALAMVGTAAELAATAFPTGTSLMRQVRHQNDVEPGGLDGFAREHESVARWHDRQFMTVLFGALGSVKTFLDLYTKLMANAIEPNTRAKIQFNTEKTVIGGALLSWLGDRERGRFTNRDKLVEIIKEHKARWIDKVVKMRHDAMHAGRIAGYRDMTLALTKPILMLSVDDVVLARMPDGTSPPDYVGATFENAKAFVIDTRVLLPGMKPAASAP